LDTGLPPSRCVKSKSLAPDGPWPPTGNGVFASCPLRHSRSSQSRTKWAGLSGVRLEKCMVFNDSAVPAGSDGFSDRRGWWLGHSRGRFRVDSAEPGSAGAVPRQRSADRQPGRSLWLFYTSGRGSHDPCQLVWQVKKFAGARGRRHALLRALACQTCAPARQAGRGRSWVPSLEMCRTTRRFPGSNQCRLGRHFAG
jgi:hypothetical protein